jgi:hypothetical protein
MTYEVQTYTLCQGWINLWTDSLNDTLVTFDTFEAAQAELQDFLAELASAVKAGYLDDYNPEDYKIEKVTA